MGELCSSNILPPDTRLGRELGIIREVECEDQETNFHNISFRSGETRRFSFERFKFNQIP